MCSFLENTRQLFRPIRIEQRRNVCSFLENTCQLFRPIRIEQRGNVCSFLEKHMSVSQTDRKIKTDGKCFSSFLENAPISYSDLYEKTRGEMFVSPFLKTHTSVIHCDIKSDPRYLHLAFGRHLALLILCAHSIQLRSVRLY